MTPEPDKAAIVCPSCGLGMSNGSRCECGSPVIRGVNGAATFTLKDKHGNPVQLTVKEWSIQINSPPLQP